MDRRSPLAVRAAPALLLLVLSCGAPLESAPAPAVAAAPASEEIAPAPAPDAPAPEGAPTLWGRVVDGAGRPMAEVPVKLYGGFATRWEVGATVTDADGYYAFADVEGRGSRIGEERSTYVGVCVGEGLSNLNPAAYLPWTDVTIPPGGSLRHDVVLDLDEVARRAAAERERR